LNETETAQRNLTQHVICAAE